MTQITARLSDVLAAALDGAGARSRDDGRAREHTVTDVQMVGQDLIGLVPEGVRFDGHSSGVITEGLLAGATTTGIDDMLIRHDGVGVLDVRGFAVHPVARCCGDVRGARHD